MTRVGGRAPQAGTGLGADPGPTWTPPPRPPLLTGLRPLETTVALLCSRVFQLRREGEWDGGRRAGREGAAGEGLPGPSPSGSALAGAEAVPELPSRRLHGEDGAQGGSDLEPQTPRPHSEVMSREGGGGGVSAVPASDTRPPQCFVRARAPLTWGSGSSPSQLRALPPALAPPNVSLCTPRSLPRGGWGQTRGTRIPGPRWSHSPDGAPRARADRERTCWRPCPGGGRQGLPWADQGRPRPPADGRLPQALVHHGRPEAHVLQGPPGKDGPRPRGPRGMDVPSWVTRLTGRCRPAFAG